jgi:aryl-phospho-beta-D-glucosidase BglC (GH1 family)
LDLHTVPGCQNTDWHSDNQTNRATFWEHIHFQDRAVELWKFIANRYKQNKWVAGYNPLNEPTDEQHIRLIQWYERVEKVIRGVDPNHILFLDGNTFAMDFSRFDTILPNCVYACHDYSVSGLEIMLM